MEENNREVLERGLPIEFEETLSIDGVTYVLTSIKTPLKDEDEVPCGIVGVSTDVTERKRLIEALQQADRRKDEFLALLAHELRNPLAPIANAVELMRQKALQDEQLVWCRDVIDRQARHLTRLVDDLVDVSRIACGKINLQRQSVDVTDVIGRALETCRPVIDSRRQELVLALPGGRVEVHGDPLRLAQVVANLLNNAARYSDNGRKIWLQVEAAGGEVLIRVKDEGVGIPAELLSQLFELFTQGEPPLERAHGGLGVGLALVRRLVEMHGGSVTAHSEGRGKGSEFVVRLPLSQAVASAPAPAAIPEAGVQAGGRRVLIVDDNVDSARSLSLLLECKGYSVRMANDGLTGLSLASGFRPQIVLLDIGMPGMNGYDVARRIREQPWGKAAALIAVTGWSQAEARQRTQEAGFDAHVVKPLEPALLDKLLSTLPGRDDPAPDAAGALAGSC
jgi:signal transduction histidine kinase/ActR/RegA family two-component response regulator